MKFLFALIVIAVIAIVYVIKERVEARQCEEALKSMSNAELIQKFNDCVKQLRACVENGNGLKGPGSTYATNRINEQITMYKNIGRNCADELAARGHKVDVSLLNVGFVSK